MAFGEVDRIVNNYWVIYLTRHISAQAYARSITTEAGAKVVIQPCIRGRGSEMDQ
jgi:hypothetical protein